MEVQTVTIELPTDLYERIKERADRAHRTVEAELIEVFQADAQALESDSEVDAVIGSLHYLDDKTLWQAARSRLPAKITAKMERLHHKRGRGEKLTEAEQNFLTETVEEYQKRILIRAKAAVLLKERGHDISRLVAPE